MARKPLVNDTGPGHCFDQQMKNWLTRDDPTRDKNLTSGDISRDELTKAVKKEVGK